MLLSQQKQFHMSSMLFVCCYKSHVADTTDKNNLYTMNASNQASQMQQSHWLLFMSITSLRNSSMSRPKYTRLVKRGYEGL